MDTDIIRFLTQLASGAFGGAIVSFLLKNVKWFNDLEGDVKRLLILGIYIGVPGLATVLLQNVSAVFWAAMQPYFTALALGFAGWLGSEIYYQTTQKF